MENDWKIELHHNLILWLKRVASVKSYSEVGAFFKDRNLNWLAAFCTIQAFNGSENVPLHRPTSILKMFLVLKNVKKFWSDDHVLWDDGH